MHPPQGGAWRQGVSQDGQQPIPRGPALPVNPIRGLYQHALDRYLQRSKCRCPQRACAAILRLGDRARHLGADHWTAAGWILVIRDGWIRTLFRPDTPRIRALIRGRQRKPAAQTETDEP